MGVVRLLGLPWLKYRRLGGLPIRNLFLTSSEHYHKSEVRVLAGLSSSEVSFLDLEVCLHTFFSLYLHVLITSFCKDASHWTRIHPHEPHLTLSPL